MIDFELDGRPAIVAVAGPNGAGKTTFFQLFLADAGLRTVNADDISRGLDVTAYEAAALAEATRRHLVQRRESLIFETVFSDPVGAKIAFLAEVATAGYQVVLCFIGIAGPAMSEQRVATRVSRGGHDVPLDKLTSRFPRTVANLKIAIQKLPIVLVYDNSDSATPFRKVAEYQNGRAISLVKPLPGWLPQI
jgi:predicted ABC-type ATPase